MTDLVPQRPPKAVKAWARMVARAWLDDKFKQLLLNQPEKVFEEFGIAIPEGLKVQVKEIEGKLKNEPIQFSIPHGIPIKIPFAIPTGFIFKLEDVQIDSEAGLSIFKLSVGIPGVKVTFDRISESLVLTFPLPKESPDEDLDEAELNILTSIFEEMIDLGDECCLRRPNGSCERVR